MFNFARHDIWIAKMSSHLKSLGHLAYQASTQESFPNSSKHKKANALALRALRASLNENLLHVFDRYDSAFAVWSMLSSPELPKIINKIRRSRRDISEEPCFMVHGNDSHEVQSDSQLDDCSSSYCYGCGEVQTLNVELTSKLEIFLEKHELLKKKHFDVKEELKDLCSTFETVLQEKGEIASERDSLKSQLELALKEIEVLKNRNDCDDTLKNNKVLSSKLDLVLKENIALKNEIDFISKELDLVLNKNKSLKNNIDFHVCHANIATTSSTPIACSTLSSSIENDINDLKRSVDCLGSTLSHCAMNHTRLESLVRKKQVPTMHAHPTRHTHAHHGHNHNMYAHVYTCTHCGRKGHLARFCYDRLHVENLATNLVWVRRDTNPRGPTRKWVPRSTSLMFDVGGGSRIT